MCKLAWHDPFSFLNVDRLLPEMDGKYRRCFMEKYCLTETQDDELAEIYTKRSGPKNEAERRAAEEKQRHKHYWKRGKEKTSYPAQYKTRVLHQLKGRGHENALNWS